MVLGHYPAQGTNQLISREWIDAARARWDVYVAQHGEMPPAGTRPVMGLDVAEFGPDHNVVCFRYGGWVAQLVGWSGVDPVVTGDRGAVLYHERAASTAKVDATGVGAGVAPYMVRKKCHAEGVKVASKPTFATELGEFAQLRDQLWWAGREWLRIDPGAMLPPDEELCEELRIPTYEVAGGKIKVMTKDTMRELLRRSPDKADAFLLTFAPDSAGGVGFIM